MNGFSAEPGERSAARHVDGAGALARRDSRRCRPGPAPRRVALSITRIAAESCASERARRARAPASRGSPAAGASIVEPMDLARPGAPRPRLRPRGRRASGTAAAPAGTASAFAACGFGGVEDAARDGPVEHPVAGAPRRRRRSGRGGASPATAAARRGAPPRRRTGASAPGRNRRASRRACPRDCRHRARA